MDDYISGDDLADVKLVRLVGSIVDKADIIDGKVDVNENGVIDSNDDRADVLWASFTSTRRSEWISSTAWWT